MKTAKTTATAGRLEPSLIVLMIVLICTNAWFLPHIFSHLG